MAGAVVYRKIGAVRIVFDAAVPNGGRHAKRLSPRAAFNGKMHLPRLAIHGFSFHIAVQGVATEVLFHRGNRKSPARCHAQRMIVRKGSRVMRIGNVCSMTSSTASGSRRSNTPVTSSALRLAPVTRMEPLR